jgi:hypothetical protein
MHPQVPTNRYPYNLSRNYLNGCSAEAPRSVQFNSVFKAKPVRHQSFGSGSRRRGCIAFRPVVRPEICPSAAGRGRSRWQVSRSRSGPVFLSQTSWVHRFGRDLFGVFLSQTSWVHSTNAQLVWHLLDRGFRETDASIDSMARRSRKTWLYGDPVEADGTQSLYGSRRRRPEFIQIATYPQKVIPRRQPYICRLVKGASANVDMIRFEPTRLSIWQSHRSANALH